MKFSAAQSGIPAVLVLDAGSRVAKDCDMVCYLGVTRRALLTGGTDKGKNPAKYNGYPEELRSAK